MKLGTPIKKSCFAFVWAIQKLRHIILPIKVSFQEAYFEQKIFKVVDLVGRFLFEMCGKKNYQKGHRVRFLCR